MVDWFIEDQKVKDRGWRKEEFKRASHNVELTLAERFLKIKPIRIDLTELWSIDFIWVNSTTIGAMLSAENMTTESVNASVRELKNQLVYPIIINFDIDKGRILETKNSALAKVAYEIGIKRVPMTIFNYQNGKIINANLSQKIRYSHYWKFIPYTFDSPEYIFNARQKQEWKKQLYLINNRQLFSDPEWTELRKSFLKTWNVTPEQNVKRLRAYLGDYKDKLRILRVRNYLNGDGFKPGIIEHAIIDQLKEELNHHFI
jgi:hypothetical protein